MQLSPARSTVSNLQDQFSVSTFQGEFKFHSLKAMQRSFIVYIFMIFMIIYIYSYVYLCIYTPSYEHCTCQETRISFCVLTCTRASFPVRENSPSCGFSGQKTLQKRLSKQASFLAGGGGSRDQFISMHGMFECEQY